MRRFMCFLIVSLCVVSQSSAATDFDAPVLDSISLNSTVFDASVPSEGVIEFSVSASDATGIDWGNSKLTFRDAGGNYQYAVTDNSNPGVLTRSLSANDKSGEWEILWLTLVDTVGNTKNYYQNTSSPTLSSYGVPDTIAVSGGIESSPPVLASISVNATALDVSSQAQDVIFEVSASDESGVDWSLTEVVFNAPGGGYKKAKGDNANPGVLTASFDNTEKDGEWKIGWLTIYDTLGNHANIYYNTGQNTLAALGLPEWISLVGGIESVLPELTSISASVSRDGDFHRVTFVLTAEDASGIDWSTTRLALKDPDGQYEFLSSTDGVFSKLFDTAVKPGTWSVNSVTLFDTLQNSSFYAYSNEVLSQHVVENIFFQDGYVLQTQIELNDVSSPEAIEGGSTKVRLSVNNLSGEATPALTFSASITGAEVTLDDISSDFSSRVCNLSTTNSDSYVSCVFPALGASQVRSIYISLNNLLVGQVHVESNIRSVYLNDNSTSTTVDSLITVLPDADSDGDGVGDTQDAFPNDPNETTDTDGDGLGDNYELANGLNVNSSDSDEDGISDYDEVQQGSDPLDINSPFRPSALSVVELQDFNGDGVAEIAQFGVLNDGTDTPQLVILDPVTKATLSTYSWLADWSRPQLIKLADRNNDGIAEVALYGKRKDDGRMQLVVKSGATGAGMGTWSWPNSWSAPRFVELKDISGDGQNEYAIFGRYSANNVPQLVVRDGVSKAEIVRYKFTPAWKNEVPLQWDDLTHDGIAEAAMFGEHRSNGKTFLYMVDGNAPDLKLSQYNWPNKWANPSFHLLPDLDGDGIREPAVFGVNLDDGRPQLQIKKGNTKKGVYAIYNWLATFSEVQFYQLGDQNGDGVEDFGVLAYNSANDKRQLMVKDGMDRTVTLANYFWPDNWDNARIVELDDLTGDGLPEIGLIGNNRSTGAVQMQVKDRATRGLLNTYTFSATDSMTVKVINVGDVDGDGTPDVGSYSVEGGRGTLELHSGADNSVLIQTLYWQGAWR